MTSPAQVRVLSSRAAFFGGICLRRLSVALPHRNCALLLHEGPRGSAFVLEDGAAADHLGSVLNLRTDWGEALGQIQDFSTDASGQITAFELRLRLRSGDATPVTIAATDLHWNGGELYCHRRLAYALRDVQKGKRARIRPQAA